MFYENPVIINTLKGYNVTSLFFIIKVNDMVLNVIKLELYIQNFTGMNFLPGDSCD